MPNIKCISDKILFVDDEVNVLRGYIRQLRKMFTVHIAVGGEKALEVISQHGPFAVVVSDLKMPQMDGVEFLSRVKDVAPDSVRMLLTGFADLQSAMDAVNHGHVFRFLTKPCNTEDLVTALVNGVRQYRLVNVEKELLEQTVKGSVKLLTDLLYLLTPKIAGRSARITRHVKLILSSLTIPNKWAVETGAMLSQIGYLILPDDLTQKVINKEKINDHEMEVLNKHTQTAASLISNIPRMEEIEEMLIYQEKQYDGSGYPKVMLRGEDIPLGSRILKVALDYESLLELGNTKGKSLVLLKEKSGQAYDPMVLKALESGLGLQAKYDIIDAGIYDLKPGMILADDVMSVIYAKKLMVKGTELSETFIQFLRNYNRASGVQEPIKVVAPL